jgi:hypothetical protein
MPPGPHSRLRQEQVKARQEATGTDAPECLDPLNDLGNPSLARPCSAMAQPWNA